jgi:uncharacterized integral membrane protein
VTTDAPLPAETPEPKERKPAVRRARGRLLLGIVIGVLGTIFAVLNLDETKVNWIIGTWSTPVILVIVVSFAIGVIVDRAVGTLHRRRKRSAKA